MHLKTSSEFVTVDIVVLGVVTPCSLVGGYQRFGGTYSLHLQGTILHSATTQKTTVDIFTAVTTSNLRRYNVVPQTTSPVSNMNFNARCVFI
jgi:hypothetical protein